MADDAPAGRLSGSPLGVVLAGGESSRYGAPKALATVGGVRIVDRVIAALRRVVDDVVISANEPVLFEDLAIPAFSDARPGLGPLGGIYTALLRARDEGRPGILAAACDMPFPCVALLAALREGAFGDRAAGALPGIVLPASTGPRGVEPLFAAYRTACIPAIDAALAEGDRRMIGFHARVAVDTIPLEEVASLCDPARAFLNVNTPEDRERAETMAAEAGRER